VAGLTIRDAGAGDMPAVAAIWNRAIRETDVTFTTLQKDPAALAAALPHTPCFLVAETGGTVAGFALYDRFRKGPGYDATMELTLYVAEGRQGAGIGAELMEALIARATAAGLGVLVAGITGGNEGSVRFHERHGFALEGRLGGVGRKWGRSYDLILMTRRLG